LSPVRVAITGADGFVGRNLALRLRESSRYTILPIDIGTSDADRRAALAQSDVVIHLAGVNRPKDEQEFAEGNSGFTATLCDELKADGRAVPVVFTSSAQAVRDNPYGRSKRDAESALEAYAQETGARVAILRLWNVFGKWARPNYNSAVATFCHNIARGLPIRVDDPTAVVRLVYIDDVVDAMIAMIDAAVPETGLVEVGPVHETTVGELAGLINRFAQSRTDLSIGKVGTGFVRALYATYVSYLPPESFAYGLTKHADPRGVFAEMLRTPETGQFSFFTALPGVTRGGHYHHTKTEKFLVVQGEARFGFRHVLTGERVDLVVRGEEARVVETVPGWVHDITNIGTDVVVVLLWANEVFDPQRPDTIAAKVDA
jgi:UDP-2-acetamido-2,6-beta-L-arabino-hexul-4-ose reductase